MRQVTIDVGAASSSLWASLLPLLAGGLISLVSAWAAFRWSIKGFRSQKWWEIQSQTYLGLLENLAIIKHFYESSIEAMNNPAWASGPNEILAGKLSAARAEVTRVAAMGALYVSPEASAGLDELVGLFGVDRGLDPHDDFPDYLSVASKCLELIRKEAEISLHKRPWWKRILATVSGVISPRKTHRS